MGNVLNSDMINEIKINNDLMVQTGCCGIGFKKEGIVVGKRDVMRRRQESCKKILSDFKCYDSE